VSIAISLALCWDGGSCALDRLQRVTEEVTEVGIEADAVV
jgi:hypothetical protein